MTLDVYLSPDAKSTTRVTIDDLEEFYAKFHRAEIELRKGERVPLERVFPVFSSDEGSI